MTVVTKGLISVVIPIYNAEKTIAKCIDSILCQTYQDFEILLINDGSLDNSEEVCLKYVEKDKRVHYIKKENGGVSTARNRGIDEAKGEYISFIDSDDWIEPDTLQVLLNSAIASNADVVIPRSRMVFCDAQGNFDKYVYNEDDYDLVVTKDTIRDEFEHLRESWALYSTCGRLYSKKHLDKYNIRFDKDIKVLEDLCFNLDFIKQAKTISHISNVVYNFLVLGIEGYASKRKYTDYIISNEKVYCELKDFLDYHKMKFTQSQFNFLLGYWIFAIEGVLNCEDGKTIKNKNLKLIIRKVEEQGIYDNCNKGAFDRKYSILFVTKSLIAFYCFTFIKKLLRR